MDDVAKGRGATYEDGLGARAKRFGEGRGRGGERVTRGEEEEGKVGETGDNTQEKQHEWNGRVGESRNVGEGEYKNHETRPSRLATVSHCVQAAPHSGP